MKEYVIEKLTKLLIKQDFEDKKKGKETYIKKTTAYKDLIKFIKENRNVVIVGGSGLYIKSLLYDYKFQDEYINESYEEKLRDHTFLNPEDQ